MRRKMSRIVGARDIPQDYEECREFGDEVKGVGYDTFSSECCKESLKREQREGGAGD
jgi:hypothetical protein